MTAANSYAPPAAATDARDLPAIRQQGVLRHLGVPYARFVTGADKGLDVEIMKMFCDHIGVRYQFVKTSWANVFADLTGRQYLKEGKTVDIKGDIAAHGITILPWRANIIDFSYPLFPTQVWLVARADSAMKPIVPSGDIESDIAAVKTVLMGREVLGKISTCLDPTLYNLEKNNSKIVWFDGSLNELVPAIINGEAETTLIEVADAMIALEKWPGQVKIIGPVSPRQAMAWAFPKEAPLLRKTFNNFFVTLLKNGTYEKIVKKYYPLVFQFYPSFFHPQQALVKNEKPTENQ